MYGRGVPRITRLFMHPSLLPHAKPVGWSEPKASGFLFKKTTIENLLKTLLKQARQKEARMFARPGLFAA